MRRRFRTGIVLIIIAFFLLLQGISLYMVEDEYYDEFYDEYYYYRPNEEAGAALIFLSIFFIIPVGAITLGSGYSSDKKKLNKIKEFISLQRNEKNNDISISELAIKTKMEPKEVTYSLKKLKSDNYFDGVFSDSNHFQLSTTNMTNPSFNTKKTDNEIDISYDEVIKKYKEFKKQNPPEQTNKIEKHILTGDLQNAYKLLDNKDSILLKKKRDELKKENPLLNLTDLNSFLEKNDYESAEKCIDQLEKELDEFKDKQESLKKVSIKLRKLTDRLADGELDSESYKRAANDLEQHKKNLEEKLWKLRNKLFKDEYEKPF